MDFRAQVAEQKKRLAQQQREVRKRMTEVEAQLGDLASELQGIDGEMAAIEAYENAIPGKPASRARRGSKSDAPRARSRRRRPRGSRRAEILSAIAAFGSAGATRQDIIAALNAKGDRSAERSISNALAALKKSGAVAHEDGKYVAPSDPTEGETPAPPATAAESAPDAS